MYCPSCENLMLEEHKYCGRCGMPLNRKSEKIVHLSMDFAWIWRRSWAGFVAAFIGWIIVFIISRMVKQSVGPMMINVFCGMISGAFLGSVGGILEESGYKSFLGGILGTLGGALGGLFVIPMLGFLEGTEKLFSLSVLLTWSVGGAFIGATSGIMEKNLKKIYAGILFGFIGGALGGFLGSIFYGSLHMEFELQSWISNRMAEGLSGGIVGAVLWFFIGLIEKLYIFHRKEDIKRDKKICDFCGKHNPLRFWYCFSCGHILQTSAPREKIEVTKYRGIERIVNSFKFMSWLFGVTGVIVTPIIFLVFLLQDIILALIATVFTVLLSYFMVVFFRLIADLFLCVMDIASKLQPGDNQKQ